LSTCTFKGIIFPLLVVKHHLIPLSENFSQQSINEFNWEKTLTTIELQLPVLSTAVKSAL
jgi:hypothetical protein